jgi:hypothetical protein
MVNNSTNINKNYLSLQLIEWWATIPPISNHFSPKLIEWWSTFPPISTKITSYLNSLSDGQQFHPYQQTPPLTLTHWVMVNNSTNINKNHLSLQLIEWWSTIPPISPQITSHFNSLSDNQQFHQNQQESPLTSTHWVMVNNSTNINKNHLSPQLIEWWSTILSISTKITSHLNSMSDGQQFYQYQQNSPLTSTHWVMSTILPISTKITSQLNSLSDVNNSTNINKNHLSLQLIEWWLTIPPISTKITSHLNWLSDRQQFHQYQPKYLSLQLNEWWSTIPPISTKITSHLNSLSEGQQFHQYQQTPPLNSTHWVMVNNSTTNINKNHPSIQLIEW